MTNANHVTRLVGPGCEFQQEPTFQESPVVLVNIQLDVKVAQGIQLENSLSYCQTVCVSLELGICQLESLGAA